MKEQITAFSAVLTDWLATNYFVTLLTASMILVGGVTLIKRFSKDEFTGGNLSKPLPDKFNHGPMAFILGTSLGLYFAFMLAWVDFNVWGMEALFPAFETELHWWGPPIYPTQGRFFPLGHQEFRLLSFLGSSPLVYQSFAAVQIAIMILLVILLFRKYPGIYLLTSLGILLAPAIVDAISIPLFPERNIIFLLTVFVVSSSYFYKTNSTFYLSLSILVGFLMIQYKETVFVILTTWAAYILWCSWKCASRKHLAFLALGLLISSTTFLVVYSFGIIPQVTSRYRGQEYPVSEVLGLLMRSVWVWVLASAFLIRITILRRTSISPIWDAIPFVVAFFCMAYVVLGFKWEYYFAPAALLAWLYAGYTLKSLGSHITQKRDIIVLYLLVIFGYAAVLFQAQHAFNVAVQWKESMASKSYTAAFIKDFYTVRSLDGANEKLRLHFPYNTTTLESYEAAIFVGYLEKKYKITDVKTYLPKACEDQNCRETRKCVDWIDIVCNYGFAIQKNDLVVFWGPKYLRNQVRTPFRLIYSSPDIGFWHNTVHGYVFIAEQDSPVTF